jgi:hypothetical protein
MNFIECFRCVKCNELLTVNKLSSFSSGTCVSCRIPAESKTQNQVSHVPFSNTPHWISAVGIVQFDLLQGQTLELLFPPLPLSPTQETELSFLSFPDANFARDGDSIHDFVFAYNTSECDPSRATTRRAAGPTGDCGSQKRPFDPEGLQEFFCCSLFRQRKDPTITRGAQQKAVVIMSRYPFPAVTHTIAAVFCRALFDKKHEGTSVEDLLQSGFEEMQRWPKPSSGVVHSGLLLLGESVRLSAPSFDPWDILSSTWTELGRASTSGHFSFPACSQERLLDELENDHSSCAAVKTAIDAYVARGGAKAEEVGRIAIGAVPLSEEQRTELIKVLRTTASDAGRSLKINAEVRPSLLSLFTRQTAFSSRVVEVQNAQLGILQCRLQQELTASVPALPQHFHNDLFSEVDLSTALFPHLAKLWKLWEIMILGAPIAVVGNHAPTVSAICLGLASLISPIKMCGTLRPYLTINNREVDFCTRDEPSPSTILGATNPYFVRHCAKWPHLLCIASVNDDVQTHKNLLANDEKRAKQQFKLSNRMFSSRHFFTKTDKEGSHSIRTPPGPLEDYCTAGSSHTGRELLLQFHEMTSEFIAPVREIVDGVLHAERVVLQREQVDRELEPKTLVDLLQHNSRLPLRLFKNRAEMMTMYEEFLRSPTFASLRKKWVWQHFRMLVLNAERLEDLLVLEPSPAKRPHVLNLLQREFERALSAPFLDVLLASKLSLLSEDVAAVRVALTK